MITFNEWLGESGYNLDEVGRFGALAGMGAAALAGMLGTGGARAGDYTVSGQKYAEKPAMNAELESGGSFIVSKTILKEMNRSFSKNPYFSSFLAEVIQEKQFGQDAFVLEITANVKGVKDEAQAKAKVVSEMNKFLANIGGKNLQGMGRGINWSVIAENADGSIPVKFRVKLVKS
jgi:hypothetical protein